jgi:hypothetical protein
MYGGKFDIWLADKSKSRRLDFKERTEKTKHFALEIIVIMIRKDNPKLAK